MKHTAGFVFLTATVLTVRGGEPLITGSGDLPALPDGAFTLFAWALQIRLRRSVWSFAGIR